MGTCRTAKFGFSGKKKIVRSKIKKVLQVSIVFRLLTPAIPSPLTIIDDRSFRRIKKKKTGAGKKLQIKKQTKSIKYGT